MAAGNVPYLSVRTGGASNRFLTYDDAASIAEKWRFVKNKGYGGVVTALAAHVETYPTHIASLPVAVNLQCHAVRHGEVVL